MFLSTNCLSHSHRIPSQLLPSFYTKNFSKEMEIENSIVKTNKQKTKQKNRILHCHQLFFTKISFFETCSKIVTFLDASLNCDAEHLVLPMHLVLHLLLCSLTRGEDLHEGAMVAKMDTLMRHHCTLSNPWYLAHLCNIGISE